MMKPFNHPAPLLVAFTSGLHHEMTHYPPRTAVIAKMGKLIVFDAPHDRDLSGYFYAFGLDLSRSPR